MTACGSPFLNRRSVQAATGRLETRGPEIFARARGTSA
jgi:hypothetical protein